MKNYYLYFLALILLPLTGKTQVRISKIFTDNMVIQRDVQVPVWGWAEKGERIAVTFNDKTFKATPDKSGKWMIKLPSMSQGGPYSMEIVGKQNSIEIRNIMVGDVWVCSGQSNMEWSVEQSSNAEKEIASASDELIRHFKVPRSHANVPGDELAGGQWQVTGSKTVGAFTAVGYYFARELRKNIDVPVGLLNTSWGGSRVEPWMSAEALGIEDPESVMADLLRKKELESEERLQKLRDQFGEIPETDLGMKGEVPIWADPGLDESKWVKMSLPALWENAGYEGLDGIGWFRKTIDLTEGESNQPVELGLGKIDDSDVVWINGIKVGGMEQKWNVERVYEVDASILKPGKNVIAVRVEDTGGGGGIYGEPELMYLKTGNDTRTLTGDWKFRVGAFMASQSIYHNQIPTLLYNKMIYPVLDFPIKGVIWYQGESNAGNDEDALEYRKLFPAMIKDWRSRWNSGDFPFLFVQLANFLEPDEEPADHSWALLRESQSAALATPNTAQAVIIDIGEADDIHPGNKQDVGQRLSLAARKLAYGEDIVYSGPVYKSHEVKGNKVIISFDQVGSGLSAGSKYGYVRGFAIAGEDGKFVWAQAGIEGDRVVVWNDSIETPTAVRYAWGVNPDDANLYNKEGLPASPFRTDGN